MNKKNRNFLAAFIIAFLCICLVAMLAVSQTPAAPKNQSTPVPTQISTVSNLSPMDQLKALVEASLGSGNRDLPRLTSFDWSDSDKSLLIEWTLNDNLSNNLIFVGAQLDVTGMLKTIAQSGLLPDYQFVTFVGTFSLKDVYGNASESRVITANYNKSTVDKINWSSFERANIFVIADLSSIHPDLTAP